MGHAAHRKDGLALLTNEELATLSDDELRARESEREDEAEERRAIQEESAPASAPAVKPSKLSQDRFAAADAMMFNKPGWPARVMSVLQAERDALEAKSETEKPSREDPLRGLAQLKRVALVGRESIIAKAAEPVPYVWRDIAVAATIIMIAGGPGEGKTTLLFLLIVARLHTQPLPVLGREVLPAPAGTWFVLIEGEHGEGSTARKLVKSCALLGVDDAALDRIVIIARKAVRIGSPEWADITRMVAAGIVSDIAIDTVARVAPGDANNEQEQVAIFDVVAQTIDAAPSEDTKPIVWTIAHTKKGASGSLEDVSGSTQRVGQADTVILVKGEKQGGRTVSSTVTFAKLREEPDDYPEPVTFAIVNDGTGRKLHVEGASEVDDGPLEQRVLAALAFGPMTKSALSRKLKRSDKDVDGALTVLFEARAISTTNVIVRGQPRKAFELRRAPREPRLDTRRDDSEDDTR